MFCPNCGKADQDLNSYCRNCGEFLFDTSDKLSIIYKFFGINTPEKQINAGILFDLAGVIFCIILLGFLIGYFQSQADRDPLATTPGIIYAVYIFLIFISAWQFFGFFLNLNLKSKFEKRSKSEIISKGANIDSNLTAADTLELLPQANWDDAIPTNVTENTTRKLNTKINR